MTTSRREAGFPRTDGIAPSSHEVRDGDALGDGAVVPPHPRHLDDVGGDLIEVDVLRVIGLTGAAELLDSPHHLGAVQGRSLDDLQGPPRVGRLPAAQKELAPPDDDGEQVVQMVGSAAGQLAQRAQRLPADQPVLRFLEVGQGALRLLVQAGVVEGQAHVARHRRREDDARGGDGTVTGGGVEDEGAGGGGLAGQRQDEDRIRAEPEIRGNPRITGRVLDHDGVPARERGREEGQLGHGAAPFVAERGGELGVERAARALTHEKPRAAVAALEDGAAVHVARPGGRLADHAEQDLEIQVGGDRARQVDKRFGVPKTLPGFPVEPFVLEGQIVLREHLPEHRGQGRQIPRGLHHEIHPTRLHRLDGEPLVALRRDHHDRGADTPRAECGQDFEPVHAGQAVIEQDDGVAITGHRLKAGGAVAHDGHSEALALERALHELGLVDIVLDDEDMDRRRRLLGAGGAGGSAVRPTGLDRWLAEQRVRPYSCLSPEHAAPPVPVGTGDSEARAEPGSSGSGRSQPLEIADL